MKALQEFKSTDIEYIFTDIDDTLTKDGRLEAEAFLALWKLSAAGKKLIPVTGRPAGWCELIARQWPVEAVIGENGGLYYHYKNKKMNRFYAIDEDQRQKNRHKLDQIQKKILEQVSGSALASDQFCRVMDLAIDFCEDVPPLAQSEVQKIVRIFTEHGATAKVSSIHVNGWFGNYNKLTTCQLLCENVFGFRLIDKLKQAVFIGDSPNDEPMFDFFENSVAVANILKFKNQLTSFPKYITSKDGGQGFAQLAQIILNPKKPQ